MSERLQGPSLQYPLGTDHLGCCLLSRLAVGSQAMALLFISHDLAAIRFLCSRMAVLQSGRLVDEFPSSALFAPGRHAYTRRLAECAME